MSIKKNNYTLREEELSRDGNQLKITYTYDLPDVKPKNCKGCKFLQEYEGWYETYTSCELTDNGSDRLIEDTFRKCPL